METPGWPHAGTTETFQMLIASGQKWTKKDISFAGKMAKFLEKLDSYGLMLQTSGLPIAIAKNIICILKPCKQYDIYI